MSNPNAESQLSQNILDRLDSIDLSLKELIRSDSSNREQIVYLKEAQNRNFYHHWNWANLIVAGMAALALLTEVVKACLPRN